MSIEPYTTDKEPALHWLLRPIDRRFGTYRGLLRLMLAHAELRSGRLGSFLNPDLRAVERIVFVCQGNICRSCFAEWSAKGQGINAVSLGFATAGDAPAHPTAIEAARKFGVDLSLHRTTDLEDFRFGEGDLVLAMEVRQARRLVGLLSGKQLQIGLLGLWARPVRPHIHDPNRLGTEYFDTCFGVLSSAVAGLANALSGAHAPASGGARS